MMDGRQHISSLKDYQNKVKFLNLIDGISQRKGIREIIGCNATDPLSHETMITKLEVHEPESESVGLAALDLLESCFPHTISRPDEQSFNSSLTDLSEAAKTLRNRDASVHPMPHHDPVRLHTQMSDI